MKIGFVGLGLMGAPMAERLRAAGHDLVVTSRRQASAEALLADGARWAGDPRSCSADRDVVILMLPDVATVEQVALGPRGVLSAEPPPVMLIDMSTTAPDLTQRIAERSAERGVAALDAPVSGGPAGAKAGTLSIMVGGDEATFRLAAPILSELGTARLLGPTGAGQRTKLLNQIMIANIACGIAEAWTMCRDLGLSFESVHEALSGGLSGGALLSFMWPRLVAGDFAPGFKIDHMIKDLTLALDEASRHGIELAGTRAVAERYRDLAADGHGALGTQALAISDGFSGASSITE